jgi:hypothetical protein
MDDAAIDRCVEAEVAIFRRSRQELANLAKVLTRFGDDTPFFDTLVFPDKSDNFDETMFRASWALRRDTDSAVHASFHVEGCWGFKIVAYVVLEHEYATDCACQCLKQQQWYLYGQDAQSPAEIRPLLREVLLTALQTVKACAIVQSQESKDAELRQEQLRDMWSDYNATVADNCADL